MTKSKEALVHFLRFLARIKTCDECLGLDDAFEGKHFEEWKRIEAKMKEAVRNETN